jgi:hypothetical protein
MVAKERRPALVAADARASAAHKVERQPAARQPESAVAVSSGATLFTSFTKRKRFSFF